MLAQICATPGSVSSYPVGLRVCVEHLLLGTSDVEMVLVSLVFRADNQNAQR